MLTYGQGASMQTQQPTQPQYQQYAVMNPMYQYMQMGGGNQMGGQMWGYGMNPNWYRQ